MMELFRHSQHIMDDIATKLIGLQVPGLSESKRLQIACALLKLVIDHCQGIVVLVNHELYSSALALQRSCFDAFIRGIWATWCATEDELIKLIDGSEIFPTSKCLLQRIENNKEWHLEELRHIKDSYWNYWCDLTHGGMYQVVRQISETGIESNHGLYQIEHALHWTNMWHILSALQLSIISKDDTLTQYFCDILIKYPDV